MYAGVRVCVTTLFRLRLTSSCVIHRDVDEACTKMLIEDFAQTWCVDPSMTHHIFLQR